MARPSSLPVVGVVTVVHPEHDATLRAFGMTDANRVAGGGRLYFESTYQTRFSGPVRLVLSPIGQAGNDTSAVLATELIGRFKPKFMLLCGIAGGIRGKNRIGDVVVSREIVDTTEKVAKGGQMLPRPDISRPLRGVLQMTAAAKVKTEELHSRFEQLFDTPIKPPRGKAAEYKEFVATRPSVHEAAIVSDNTLLRDPAVLAHVASTIHEQARAGEMEAGGFVNACLTAHPPVPWYVARGISDFADEFKNDLFHALASAAVAAYAAAFVSDVLDLRIWDDIQDSAEPKQRHRWDFQTGDYLIDEALTSFASYDAAGASDPVALRKIFQTLVNSRTALNPYVYYEETARFLFVICWVRRLVMAYQTELAATPATPKLITKIIGGLHEVETKSIEPFGPSFRLTPVIEQHLGDKEQFLEALGKYGGGMVMSRTDLEVLIADSNRANFAG